ncbi:hypothetical protein TYRP_008469 [Tyrophagus putrescentiae]|nr:hypothetical protein TYRP_008469 [Tyrophagus putrescentiae]
MSKSAVNMKSTTSSTGTAHHRRTTLAAAVLLLLVIGQLLAVSTAAPALDEEYFRSLLDLLKQEGVARPSSNSMFVHQMERKGGRSPTLRLRFGRRSDPLWSKLMPNANSNNQAADDDVVEKVQYK